jgi:hypothetical protein
MTQNAGIDPRVAAAEQSADPDAQVAADQTSVAEDPSGETAASAGADPLGEPDELH